MVVRFTYVLAFMAIALLLSGYFGAPSYSVYAAGQNDAGPKKGTIPGHFIVVVNDNASAEEVARAHSIPPAFVYKSALNGFAGPIGAEKLDALKQDPRVRYVENDQWVSTFAQTTPTGIKRAGVEENLTAKIDGSPDQMNVDIAIIDTGVDASHPDLNVHKSIDCRNATTASACVTGGSDGNGHGTHVAGTAAAIDNGQGVVGVSPGARIWSVKVLDDNGSGRLSWVIAGVNWVTENASAVEVANMSLGCECISSALDTAITNSVAAGITYVVAAGNMSKDASTFSPANHPDVITVSAMVDTDGKCGGQGPSTNYGSDDTFASFSNFGQAVDIAAPGVSIYSTYKGGNYATMSGTSMASPHVAGAAALYKVANPSASPGQIKDALLGSAVSQSFTCDAAASTTYGGLVGPDPDSKKEPVLHVGAGQGQNGNQDPSPPADDPPTVSQLSVAAGNLSHEQKGKSGSAKLFAPVTVSNTGGATANVTIKIFQSKTETGGYSMVAQGSATLGGDGTVKFEYSRAACGNYYYADATASSSGNSVSAQSTTYKIVCG
jgi:subtilisin family serine protease